MTIENIGSYLMIHREEKCEKLVELVADLR